MKYLCVLLLLLTHTAFAQTAEVIALQNKLCTQKIDGSGKALGVKMSLSVPCAWEVDKEASGKTVKGFADEDSDDMITETVKISAMKDPNKKIDDIINPTEAKKKLPKGINYISSRKLKVGGMDCGEILLSLSKNLLVQQMHMYLFNYYFIYEGKNIIISYTVGADNEKEARKMFEDNKGLFMKLVSGTRFGA